MKKIKGKWSKVRRSAYPFEEILGNYQALIIEKYCKGQSLLDLGCGEGLITSKLRGNFKKIVGVDGTKSQIMIAKKKYPDIEFINSAIEDFDTNHKFDCILLISILEHVEEPFSILRLAKKWVKKGGQIHIQVPNGYSLNRRLGKIMGILENETQLHKHDKDLGHRRMFDMKSLLKLVNSSKLKIIKSGGIFLKIHSNRQMQIVYDSNLWENKQMKKKYFDALFELGKELPDYASTLYVHCKKI